MTIDAIGAEALTGGNPAASGSSIGGAGTDPEFKIGPLENAAESAQGPGFGSVLGNQIENLTNTQNLAAEASRQLATGAATDPSSAIVAVDRARLAMQLAATLRTKGVEAAQEVLRTQI